MIYKKFDEIIQFTYSVIEKHEILPCYYLETWYFKRNYKIIW